MVPQSRMRPTQSIAACSISDRVKSEERVEGNESGQRGELSSLAWCLHRTKRGSGSPDEPNRHDNLQNRSVFPTALRTRGIAPAPAH